MPDERIAVLETRVDSMDARIGGIESNMADISEKIDDIHTVVVANKTNMGWVKKLTIIILGLCLSGATVYGYKSLDNKEVVSTIHHHNGHKTVKEPQR